MYSSYKTELENHEKENKIQTNNIDFENLIQSLSILGDELNPKNFTSEIKERVQQKITEDKTKMLENSAEDKKQGVKDRYDEKQNNFNKFFTIYNSHMSEIPPLPAPCVVPGFSPASASSSSRPLPAERSKSP